MKPRLQSAAPGGANLTDRARLQARATANAEDANVWRWFSLLLQESRIRWLRAPDGWLVSIDHRHIATEASFDEAMRAAKARLDGQAGRD
ncbi:hypothetical protein BYI23_C006730 [Burkholderia sp. YI23]|uniref:Uncharacterized protein n=1 Tax=Caballeronia cordobensis TaxID=1353886 RepID=A0A158HJY0_CABCO|nr:hypothetical protein [Caballeronia cordobensis]AET92819.1 hypothetical protein BYI23_C006730 [Burkholderia sp. YI23]SAL44596.1 hypothetical protein AWB70_03421 [Caballeronia cordobensis]